MRIATTLAGISALLAVPGAAWAAPTPISLGDAVQGAVTDPTVPAQYTFDAPAGAALFLDRTATSNRTGLNWTVSDAYGRVLLQDTANLDDLGPATLMGGTYNLTIFPEAGQTGTFEFTLVDATPGTHTAALGDAVAGAIAAPGQRQRYTFHADPGARLFVDFTASSDLTGLDWTLEDQGGRALMPWTSALIDAGPYDLAGGDYTLTLRGEGDRTGTFEFTLEQPSDQTTPVTLDTVISSAITVPGQKRDFVVDAPGGTVIALDPIASSNLAELDFEVLDSFGRVLLPRTIAFLRAGPVVLPGGSCVVRVVGEEDAVGTFDFVIATVSRTTTDVALDEVFSGDIDLPGATRAYRFQAPAGQEIFVDRLATTASAALNWWLEDATGRPIFERTTSLVDQGPFTLLGGEYTLHVVAEGGNTGTFQAVVHALVDDGGPIALGDVVTGSIDQPAAHDTYTFTAPPGQLLLLDEQASSNITGLNWELLDAQGRAVLPRTTDLADRGPLALAGGAYTLRVLAEGSGTGTYTFQLVDQGTAPFTPSGTPISLGDVVQGSLSGGAGDSAAYTFTLANDTGVYLDLQTGGSFLRWTLTDPAGEAVFDAAPAISASLHDQGPLPLAAGTYTLTFSQTFATTSNYKAQVLAVTDLAGALTLGVPVADTLASAGGRARYALTLADAANVYLDLQAGHARLRWHLLDAVGQTVFGDANAYLPAKDDQGPFALAAGDYTLELWATDESTPAFQLLARDIHDATHALTLGTPYEGALPEPGARDLLTFTQPQDGPAFVDLVAGDSALRWTLTGPAGDVLVDDEPAAYPTTGDIGPLTLLAGTYTLTLRATDDSTPPYTLTVYNPVEHVAALTTDTVTAGQVPSPGDRMTYALTVTGPPTAVFFQALDPAPDARWRLESPQGAEVASWTSLGNPDAASHGPYLLQPGTWRLSIEGVGGATPAYRFVAHAVQDLGPVEAPLDTIVLDTLPTPGAVARYTVTSPFDGALLRFDLLQDAPDLRWTLVDPVGEPVFDGPAASWSTDDVGPLALAAGTYTLTLDASGVATPAYQFRVDGPPPPLEPADPCASCTPVDLVFVLDGAGPAVAPDAAQATCDFAASVVAELQSRGVSVTATLWTVEDTPAFPCASGSVAAALGTEVPGEPPAQVETLGACADGGDPGSDWALATAIVAQGFPWAPGHDRVVLPLAASGPGCGDPLTVIDGDAIEQARAVASAAGVRVYPALPSDAPDPLVVLANILATGTGGETALRAGAADDAARAVVPVTAASCGPGTPTPPALVELDPAPGAAVPSDQPFVLSGRVLRVGALRPDVGVLVAGVPADRVDATGRFFATVSLPPGGDGVSVQLPVELVDGCGRFPSTIDLVAGPVGGELACGMRDVTDRVTTTYSGTTFDTATDTLRFQATAHLTTGTLPGPLRASFGPDLHPALAPADFDGETPASGPYFEALPDGATLSTAPAVASLALSNPQRRKPSFSVRWWAGTNHAPIFQSAPAVTTRPGDTYAYAAAAVDLDGDDVSFRLDGGPDAMTLDPVSGALSWEVPADVPAQRTLYEVALTALDGRGGATTQRFAIEVRPTSANQPPLFTSSPPPTAAQGQPYAYAASAADPDGDPLAFTLTAGPAPASVDAATGLVQWPNATPGDHVFTLRVADGHGGEAAQTWVVTTGATAPDQATNPGAPWFASTPPAVAAVDVQTTYAVVALDPDGDDVTVALTAGPAAATYDPAAGVLTWSPSPADAGTAPVFTLMADDGRGGSAAQTFALPVLTGPPNLPPTFDTTPPLAALVGAPFTYAAHATDPEYRAVTYALPQAPPGMTVDASLGALSWAPAAADVGDVAVTLRASDPAGASSTQSWLLHVRASNDAPTITTTPETVALEGALWAYNPAAQDPDGDALRWTVTGAPAGLTLDPFAGALRWTPTADQVAPTTFTLRVEDPYGGADQQVLSVDVLSDTDRPFLLLTPSAQPACAGEPLTVCAAASDNVGVDTATFTVGLDGAPLSLDAAHCAAVTPDAPTSLSFEAEVLDVNGNLGNASLGVEVVDCAAPPAGEAALTLLAPADGALTTGPLDVVAHLDAAVGEVTPWRVEVSSDGAAWHAVAQGEERGPGELRATLDGHALADGAYRVRVVAGREAAARTVHVAGSQKVGALRVVLRDVVGGRVVTQTYDSTEASTLAAPLLGASGGALGVGWRLGLAGGVRDEAAEAPRAPGDAGRAPPQGLWDGARVIVARPGGGRVGFTFRPGAARAVGGVRADRATAFVPDPGVRDRLEAVGLDWVQTRDGRVWVADGSGRPTAAPYNPGRYRLRTWDGWTYRLVEGGPNGGPGGVERVTDPTGRVVFDAAGGQGGGSLGDWTLSAPAGAPGVERVSARDDPRRAVRYRYDARGRLAEVADAAGVRWALEYDDGPVAAVNRAALTAIRDGDGRAVLRVRWELGGARQDTARVEAVCWREPDAALRADREICAPFEYDGAGQVRVPLGPGVEVRLDARLGAWGATLGVGAAGRGAGDDAWGAGAWAARWAWPEDTLTPGDVCAAQAPGGKEAVRWAVGPWPADAPSPLGCLFPAAGRVWERAEGAPERAPEVGR